MSEPLIRVTVDDGANIHSGNSWDIPATELGFDSIEDFRSASEDEKMEAVTDFINAMGYPEIYWKELK